jgi:hypothetical protein
MSSHITNQQSDSFDAGRQSIDSAKGFMDFECMHCGKLFQRRWFDIGAAFERVHYEARGGYDEVEVGYGEGVGVFCSRACLESGRPQVMATEGVPIPSVRPGIGPIEKCAICDGVVDMSDWHFTYTDGQMEEQSFGAVEVIDNAYLAVVCRKCRPKNKARESTSSANGEDSTKVINPDAPLLCT